MSDPSENPTGRNLSGILLVAAWFGVVGGMLDGVGKWTFQRLGLVNWWAVPSVDHNILWTSVAVDLSLFLLLGFVLAFLPRWHRVPSVAAATGLFSALVAYSLLATPGRLRELGAIILAIGLGGTFLRWYQKNPGAWEGFYRRTIRSVALSAAVACLGAALADVVREKIAVASLVNPPQNGINILLIVADTLRADRLGTYGYHRPTTPFIDELAAQGVLYERAFANSSWTLPSHVSLFTGRLPDEHGAETYPYDGRFPTLAEVLASRGYSTAGFVANHTVCNRAFGMDRGFQHWENMFFSLEDGLRRTTYGGKLLRQVRRILLLSDKKWMNADEIKDRFIRWVDRRPRRPFFAFLNLMDVHDPLAPPRQIAANFSSQQELIGAQDRGVWGMRPSLKLTLEHPEYPNAYDASLAYLDMQLRELFEALRRRGLLENLLVVFTSDHGESLGEHGLHFHRNSLYLEQIRVPLLLWFPNKLPPTRILAPMGLNQLPSTISRLVLAGESAFPGPTLRLAVGPATDEEPIVQARLTGGSWPDVPSHWPIAQGDIRSRITRRWHLLMREDGKIELYDWKNDPQERTDLASSEEGRRIIHKLLREESVQR